MSSSATTRVAAQPLPAGIAPAEPITKPALSTPSRFADYSALFKPRVSTMSIITAAAGFYLGSLRSGISPFHLGMVEALAGIAIVTCGASALNQALERRTDALMRRTRNRPMATGRIGLPMASYSVSQQSSSARSSSLLSRTPSPAPSPSSPPSAMWRSTPR